MSADSLDQYMQKAERMYRSKDGEELSQLLSLRDAHVLNESLFSSDIALLVEGNCVAPLDEVIICHLLCVKALHEKNYQEAYSHQSQCLAGIVKILQDQKGQNWCLPLMYTVCLDLRLAAQKAEATTAQSHGKLLEQAAENLLSCFRVCASDNRTPNEETKRLGMLYVTNQLLKVYFRINKLHLCKPLIRAIDSSSLWDLFPLSQKITYRYIVGRKAVFESEYAAANVYLSYAFQKCHKDSHKNKRLILIYLIPVKMLLGYMPSVGLLEKYGLLQFAELITVIKNGDLRGFDRIKEEQESFFVNTGVYLIVEQLKRIAYRNLFKKVYLVGKSHIIPLANLQAAIQMMGEEEVDADETQCIVANLIYEEKIKGYISHQHQKLVVSKHNAFPPLQSRNTP